MQNHISDQLKEDGNNLFRKGNYNDSILKFSEAMEWDDRDPKLFCNRSMAHAALKNWDSCIKDAKKAVDLQYSIDKEPYFKAYYYIIKGYLNISLLDEARASIIQAIKSCGNKKELIELEEELVRLKGHPIRPKSNDFNVLDEIGEGNFTKIFTAKHKISGNIYAIKTIEKPTVERMKRRHPNIHNEILMEKRVLNKLSHSSIVTLYSTFQDYGTLYYQMEYIDGGELWNYLVDYLDGIRYHVGCYISTTQHFFREIVHAIEYMHQKGIVHRDIKPENIMITQNKNIKIIDFGTCKDLVDKDLNGPEFVGTADYMSPLSIESKPCGIESDIWALGCLLYQMLYGFSPFNSSSHYLTFLRTQRANLKLISPFNNHDAGNLLQLLLEKKNFKRIINTSNLIYEESIVELSDNNRNELYPFDFTTVEMLKSLSYEKILNHTFLRFEMNSSINETSFNIPHLRELCVRAVGRACLVAKKLVAKNGGTVPNIHWVKTFQLQRLKLFDREQVKYYLKRCESLHPSIVHQLFFNLDVESKCKRADPFAREYLSNEIESSTSQWNNEFFFIVTALPRINFDADLEQNLKRVISCVNRLRPKFIIIIGCFAPVTELEDLFIDSLKRLVSKISDSIDIHFLSREKKKQETVPVDLEAQTNVYNENFGANYYSFWHSGVRFLMLDSSLLSVNKQNSYSIQQHKWLDEELELAQHMSTHVIIFADNSIFLRSKCVIQDSNKEYNSNTKDDDYMNLFSNHKVKYIFTSSSTDSSLITKVECESCDASITNGSLRHVQVAGLENTSESTAIVKISEQDTNIAFYSISKLENIKTLIL